MGGVSFFPFFLSRSLNNVHTPSLGTSQVQRGRWQDSQVWSPGLIHLSLSLTTPGPDEICFTGLYSDQ